MAAINKTRPQIIDASIRRSYVLEQRKGGLTYREIAAAAINKFGTDDLPKGYDERYAYADVISELKRINDANAETAAEIKDVELQRLDRMQAAVWRKVLDGHEGAIDRVLRIMDRRAKLLGLDAPTKTDLTSGGEKFVLEIVRASDAPANEGE